MDYCFILGSFPIGLFLQVIFIKRAFVLGKVLSWQHSFFKTDDHLEIIPRPCQRVNAFPSRFDKVRPKLWVFEVTFQS